MYNFTIFKYHIDILIVKVLLSLLEREVSPFTAFTLTIWYAKDYHTFFIWNSWANRYREEHEARDMDKNYATLLFCIHFVRKAFILFYSFYYSKPSSVGNIFFNLLVEFLARAIKILSRHRNIFHILWEILKFSHENLMFKRSVSQPKRDCCLFLLSVRFSIYHKTWLPEVQETFTTSFESFDDTTRVMTSHNCFTRN